MNHDTQIVQEVKPVKNSVFIKESNGTYVGMHYDSTIFKAEIGEMEEGRVYPPGYPVYKLTHLYVPSVTSSKMAKRCYEHVFGYIPDNTEWKKIKEGFNQ